MNQNPYEIFQKECPEVAARFNELIEAQKALKGLDAKTKQLVNIAIQTANRNPQGGTDTCNDGKERGCDS